MASHPLHARRRKHDRFPGRIRGQGMGISGRSPDDAPGPFRLAGALPGPCYRGVGMPGLVGVVDDMRVYNRALSDEEALSLYAERGGGGGGGPQSILAAARSNIVTVTQTSDGFDGNTRIDVSNVSNVRAKDFKGGREAGLIVAPGQNVVLDFSPGRDPEGVLGQALDTNGIFYRYQLTRGRGYVLPSSGFERRASGDDNHADPARWSNWGMAPKNVPRGDGPVDMTVRVIARDYGGREATRDLDIRLINEPPIIDAVDSEVYARGPQIDQTQDVEIGNLGNRRYRVVVEARPDPGVDAAVSYRPMTSTGRTSRRRPTSMETAMRTAMRSRGMPGALP